MSGLLMAMQLRKQRIDDFVVLEKADNVGGTWRENKYPNIACDVPSHVYSFSLELNPNWSHSYSGGTEILAYCESCVEKHDLSDFIHYNQEVKSANFVDGQWSAFSHRHVGRKLRSDRQTGGLGRYRRKCSTGTARHCQALHR